MLGSARRGGWWAAGPLRRGPLLPWPASGAARCRLASSWQQPELDLSAVPDHYATLEVDRDCETAAIRASYTQLVRQLHPDTAAQQDDQLPASQPDRMRAALDAAAALHDDEPEVPSFDVHTHTISTTRSISRCPF